jgi:hypothetical protein
MSVFQVGDRVRLKTVGRHYVGYKPGDTGTIAAELPSTARIGVELYQVDMDKDGQALRPAFYADELELVE